MKSPTKMELAIQLNIDVVIKGKPSYPLLVFG